MSVPVLSLEGQVAVINGASGGIGRAVTLLFAEAGADIVICDLITDSPELTATLDQVSKIGRKVLAYRTDISQKAEVDSVILKAFKEFGRIDILLNLAAKNMKRIPVHEMPEDEWDKDMAVNLKGYFLCSQAVAKIMKEQKRGNIISFSSVAGFKGGALAGGYGISKAGVIMLTKNLAVELGPYNIRVNCIAPAHVKTERTRSLWSNPDELKKMEANIPLGRIATPDDISPVVLFLASSAAGFITGQVIGVDGGVAAK